VSNSSDFSPSEVLDMRSPDRQPSSDDGVHKLAVLGLVLLLIGWTVLSIPHFGTTQFVLETLVLLTLGAYAFIAATRTRRTAVALEKRLRFDLLVRNIELENMAIRDDLTQLFNRRYFFERLERELEASTGFSRPLSIMVIDVNSMKSVNDNYGQKTGDEVLRNCGKFLLDRTRASDVPARIDGDEFAMILADTDESAARVAVERLLEALQKVELTDDHENPSISVSVGLAGYPWSGDTVDAIVRAADEALDSSRAEAPHRSGQTVDSSVPVAERERPVAAE
jgi:diguanylate cyclase (GGDEF)-like protein